MSLTKVCGGLDGVRGFDELVHGQLPPDEALTVIVRVEKRLKKLQEEGADFIRNQRAEVERRQQALREQSVAQEAVSA